MTALVWDQVGERRYETGIEKGVLYTQSSGAEYDKGEAWNGLTAVTESPSGAEATDLYADNIKYGTLRSAETFGATVEAYMYPDSFAACDGSAELTEGVTIGQQSRKTFGLSYVTRIGNDQSETAGYKIHLVYGATASPSERAFNTINDSPDVTPMSWEITTIPVNVTGHKPSATLVIDSTKVSPAGLAAIEKALYGDEMGEAKLPLPDEVLSIISTAEESEFVG